MNPIVKANLPIRIKNVGVVWIYQYKETSGGAVVWMYAKDNTTKMPEPVFVKEEDYDIETVLQ